MVSLSTVKSADGTKIAFRTVGEGPAVVIVHGSVTDGSDWQAVADRLAGEFTVHVMTRRGIGASGDTAPYDIQREYEDILAMLIETGASHLIGHSFGAICALGATLRAAGLQRLVLYEPPLNIYQPVVPVDALVEVEEADLRGDVSAVVESGLRRCVRMPSDVIDTLRASPVWRDMMRDGAHWARELRALHDLPTGVERYHTIATPTLLPVGETTQQHHRDAAEALLAVLARAKIVELPGVGHDAAEEAPDLLARELASFLQRDRLQD